MKKYILISTIFIVNIVAAVSKEEILESFLNESCFSYQDIIVNGSILKKGIGPDCQSRYEAIKKSLEPYRNRQIKVLDIGANNGYFSFRIAQDFDAYCTMIDYSDRLTEICKLNNQLHNLIYFKKNISLSDLHILSKEEHFDIVLALNIIHYLGPWKDIIDILFTLGDTVIIENPPTNDEEGKCEPSLLLIEEYLLRKKNGNIIALTPRTTINNINYSSFHLAKMFCFIN